MRTKTFLSVGLFITLQSLAQYAYADDEPDIDDMGMDEVEPEIPSEMEEPDVEEEPDIDEDEPEVEDEEPVVSYSEAIEEDEPEVIYEPIVEIVEKYTRHEGECEKIEPSPLGDDSDFFEFYQHDARLDPNRLVRNAYKIISAIRSEVVKKVQLDYHPQLHHEVGPYPMITHVTTVKDGVDHDHCYEIWIRILDTNECTHVEHAEWHHQCDDSTVCVNTQGSYYCACKEGEFAFPGSGEGRCQDEPSSKECCGADKHCRAAFKCHDNKCAFNDCHEDAICVPGAKGNDFTCQCQDGFRNIGDLPGRDCQPVDHCAVNKCSTNCECESIVNSTVDGYFCHAPEGSISYYPTEEEWEVRPAFDAYRLDGDHLCLDQNKPPEIIIEGDHPMVLEQGSRYIELGVILLDEDTGDLKRRFTADYNEAHDLMDKSGFVKSCGESVVSYSIETPWISSRPTLSTSREVQVVDVDECTYDGEDPDFKHTCVNFATCTNQICSEEGPGFTCVCLDEGYEEDGNNGCIDKRAPVMQCDNGDDNCGFKHLWVIKGAGAVLDEAGTRVVFSQDESHDAAWLENVISMIEIPTLKATDFVPVLGSDEDEAVDLTSTIRKGVLASYEDGLWIQPFYVTDENDNEATFNVQFTVTHVTTEMLAQLLPQIATKAPEEEENPFDPLNNEVAPAEEAVCDGNGDQSAPSFWSYFWFIFLAYCAHMSLLALCRVATAIQCLVIPASMSHQRERFNSGMDTLLYIQSLGGLQENERQKIIDAKWKAITSFNHE